MASSGAFLTIPFPSHSRLGFATTLLITPPSSTKLVTVTTTPAVTTSPTASQALSHQQQDYSTSSLVSTLIPKPLTFVPSAITNQTSNETGASHTLTIFAISFTAGTLVAIGVAFLLLKFDVWMRFRMVVRRVMVYVGRLCGSSWSERVELYLEASTPARSGRKEENLITEKRKSTYAVQMSDFGELFNTDTIWKAIMRNQAAVVDKSIPIVSHRISTMSTLPVIVEDALDNHQRMNSNIGSPNAHLKQKDSLIQTTKVDLTFQPDFKGTTLTHSDQVQITEPCPDDKRMTTFEELLQSPNERAVARKLKTVSRSSAED